MQDSGRPARVHEKSGQFACNFSPYRHYDNRDCKLQRKDQLKPKRECRYSIFADQRELVTDTPYLQNKENLSQTFHVPSLHNRASDMPDINLFLLVRYNCVTSAMRTTNFYSKWEQGTAIQPTILLTRGTNISILSILTCLTITISLHARVQNSLSGIQNHVSNIGSRVGDCFKLQPIANKQTVSQVPTSKRKKRPHNTN